MTMEQFVQLPIGTIVFWSSKRTPCVILEHEDTNGRSWLSRISNGGRSKSYYVTPDYVGYVNMETAR